MLHQLIKLTNNEDFFSNWHLKAEFAQFQNDTLRFIVSTIKDDYPPANETLQWWLIECNSYMSERGIAKVNKPNYRINIIHDHPLLWTFEEKTHLFIKGEAESLTRLLGDLFLTHVSACGNWIDFNGLIAGLHWRLQAKGSADMILPHRLLPMYLPILERHNLQVAVERLNDDKQGLMLLFIGNPLLSPDNYNFNQAYVIAKSFSAKIIEPHTSLQSIL